MAGLLPGGRGGCPPGLDTASRPRRGVRGRRGRRRGEPPGGGGPDGGSCCELAMGAEQSRGYAGHPCRRADRGPGRTHRAGHRAGSRRIRPQHARRCGGDHRRRSGRSVRRSCRDRAGQGLPRSPGRTPVGYRHLGHDQDRRRRTERDPGGDDHRSSPSSRRTAARRRPGCRADRGHGEPDESARPAARPRGKGRSSRWVPDCSGTDPLLWSAPRWAACPRTWPADPCSAIAAPTRWALAWPSRRPICRDGRG